MNDRQLDAMLLGMECPGLSSGVQVDVVRTNGRVVEDFLLSAREAISAE